MKILANDGISEDAKNQLEENGYVVITDKVNQEDLITKINEENYEGILVRSATKIRKRSRVATNRCYGSSTGKATTISPNAGHKPKAKQFR